MIPSATNAAPQKEANDATDDIEKIKALLELKEDKVSKRGL